MQGFRELIEDLPEAVLHGIADLRWSDPMPVQAKVIPVMAARKDLIVQAQTGSGKTGAFGIPLTARLDPTRGSCQALVMCPTRELANQVATEISTLGAHRGVRTVPIYGGVGYAQQIEEIQKGAHIVVGTPGRILDHLSAGRLSFDDVSTLVIDEADELLSLGFWPDMREINGYLPKARQSCLFSATIPEKVRSLSRVFLHEPEFVSLSEGQLAPQQIEHFFMVTTAQDKEVNLARLLELEDPESAIIFCNTKDDVRYVTAFLQRAGFDAAQISGDLSQAAREAAMGSIKSGTLRFLVATDVAARGIDISDLSHVISFAAPQSPEVYVHRTGRTGRAGKAGVAISLVSGFDIANFRQLQHATGIAIAERELPSEHALLDRLRERLSVKVEREIRTLPPRDREAQVDRFIPVVEDLATSEEGRRDLAAIIAMYLREHRPETTVTDTPESDDRPAPRLAPEPSAARGRPRRSGGKRGSGRRGRRR